MNPIIASYIYGSFQCVDFNYFLKRLYITYPVTLHHFNTKLLNLGPFGIHYKSTIQQIHGTHQNNNDRSNL